jgi:superoxide reductase
MKFYICPICGNIMTLISGNIDLMKCCGNSLVELTPNTVEASTEKHIPEYEIKNNKIIVSVGSVLHPMEENHHISFIALVNPKETKIVKLNITDKPITEFSYTENSTIYAYCNNHGLWSKTITKK